MGKVNFILTILVTILEFSIGILDFTRGKIVWGIIFMIITLFYIFIMVPMSWNNYKKDKELKAKEKELRERIDKEWRKYNHENLPKL